MRLEADATRLEQVISNLLNNAAHYTELGGQIALSARRDGEVVVIDVTDKTYTVELTGDSAKLDAFMGAIDRQQLLRRGDRHLGLDLLAQQGLGDGARVVAQALA